MMFTMLKRFVAEGVTPNLKRMLDEGVLSESYCAYPVWTPTNWATLITGAETGTHTVSRWFHSLPTPQDSTSTLSTFVGNAVAAETVFEAADSAGLKSVAIHYPAAGPSRAAQAHVVDGFGHPGFGSTPFEVTPALGYTNLDGIANSFRVELRPAHDWRNLPETKSPPLEFAVPIVTKKAGESQALAGLAIDSSGDGLDTLILCEERDGATELGRAAEGRWSDWIARQFTIEGSETDARFRFKTVELSPDGSRLRMYRSQVMLAHGFCEPPELAAELSNRFGPYLEHASILPYSWAIGDLDTSFEEIDYQCEWVANVGNYLLHEKGYSLLYTHIHIFDYLNHQFLADVDPASPGHSPEKAEVGWKAFRQSYVTADRMIGKLLDAADDDTAILIVSDHAAYPQVRATDLCGLLQDNGFLVLEEGFTGRFDPNEDFDRIDMARTKVFVTPYRSFELFINAPEGSQEYEEIQRDVLTLLRSWIDGERNESPVVLALPKRHAPLLGMWGEQCGDIVYFMNEGYVSGYPSAEGAEADDPYVWAPGEYGGHHSPYLSTARTAVSSNGAVFIARALGQLKKGYERPLDRLGPMSQAAVVPVVCHLLGIDPPAQAQRAVPRDFLEGAATAYERSSAVPEWEKGTDVRGFGDRVWTQGGDMVAGFFAGDSDKGPQ